MNHNVYFFVFQIKDIVKLVSRFVTTPFPDPSLVESGLSLIELCVTKEVESKEDLQLLVNSISKFNFKNVSSSSLSLNMSRVSIQ